MKPQSSDLTTAREYVVECGEIHNRMKYIAAAVIGSMGDAEDIVQQAYTIAIEKNQSFESRDKFVGWLAGIVKHCSLNYRRKRSRRKTHSVDPTNIQVQEPASATAILENIDASSLDSMQRAFDDEVMNALSNISVDARTCLILRTVENLSYKEISNLLQIPKGTAMGMVHRARIALRRALANHEFARPSNTGGSDE